MFEGARASGQYNVLPLGTEDACLLVLWASIYRQAICPLYPVVKGIQDGEISVWVWTKWGTLSPSSRPLLIKLWSTLFQMIKLWLMVVASGSCLLSSRLSWFLFCICTSHRSSHPLVEYRHTEIKVLCDAILELWKIPPVQLRVGQKTALHDLPAAGNSVFVISTISVQSDLFFLFLLQHTVIRVMGSKSDLYSCNLMNLVSSDMTFAIDWKLDIKFR